MKMDRCIDATGVKKNFVLAMRSILFMLNLYGIYLQDCQSLICQTFANLVAQT